jgi:DNA-binding response OmpR family regulator
MSATVLLFETETSLRKVMAASLEQQGFDIIQAANVDAARKHLRRDTPDLFVLELDVRFLCRCVRGLMQASVSWADTREGAANDPNGQ